MNIRHKLIHEIKVVALTTLYFAAWFCALILLKTLVLAEYQIRFSGISLALFGALIVAKVVLVLQYVPLGSWIGRQPAWVDVAVRTILYALGVLAVMLVEKAFHGRHEYGSFGAALLQVFHHAEIHHVYAAVIGIGGALLGFNVFSVLKLRLGKEQLLKVYLTPLEPPPKMPTQ